MIDENLYKNFTIRFLILVFIILFIIAFLNYYFDPYGIYFDQALNQNKPLVNTHTRIHKTQKIYLNHYDCIFLGTSRVEGSLVFEKEDPFIKKYCPTYYNAGLSAANVLEIYYMLRLAIKYSKPKKIFYGIDLTQFNASKINLNDSSLNYFNKPFYTRITHLFSYDMLKDISKTIELSKKEQNFYNANGSWNIEQNYFIKFRGIDIYKIFLITEKAFYENFYHNFKFNTNNIDTWHYYIEIIQLIKNHKEIEFYLYINPYHVRLIEVEDLRIGSENLDYWKQRLVLETYKNLQMPIYDFSGYNNITTEEIQHTKEHLEFFYDPSHVKKIVGRYILEYILENKKRNDFGTKLDIHNIQEYLEHQREKQKRWREKHSKEIQELKDFLLNK
jgi:hypothetical protein